VRAMQVHLSEGFRRCDPYLRQSALALYHLRAIGNVKSTVRFRVCLVHDGASKLRFRG
jgi:hypothetical protein